MMCVLLIMISLQRTHASTRTFAQPLLVTRERETETDRQTETERGRGEGGLELENFILQGL